MDDPHDNMPPATDYRRGWCYACDDEFETCNCGRSGPSGSGAIIWPIIFAMLTASTLLWHFS